MSDSFNGLTERDWIRVDEQRPPLEQPVTIIQKSGFTSTAKYIGDSKDLVPLFRGSFKTVNDVEFWYFIPPRPAKFKRVFHTIDRIAA